VKRKIPHLRVWIAALLTGAAVLNYVDRQTLSALAPTIQTDLGMDDRDYANVVNLFLVAYAVASLFSGRLVDRIGTRAGMAVFVIGWSLANLLSALAQGPRSLGASRFALGLGGAGVWPAASKAVSEWFPANARAFVIGAYTTGATLGAAAAPYAMIPLASVAYAEVWPSLARWLGAGTGWRVAFLLTGLAGFLLLIPWLWLYRLPSARAHSAAGEQVRTEPVGQPCDSGPSWGWRRVLRFKGTWLLLVGRLLTDPAWYFYQFWFPKYLSADRQLSQTQLSVTWLVYAAAGAGSLAGGWYSGRLIRRGRAAADSRMRVMLVCACLMPLSALITLAPDVSGALVLAAVTVVASLAWLINISALVVDLVSHHSLGTVFSVVAAGSTLGGIMMNKLVATMVSGPAACGDGFLDRASGALLGPLLAGAQGQGYAPWFVMMALLHPVAWLVLKIGGVSGNASSRWRKQSVV